MTRISNRTVLIALVSLTAALALLPRPACSHCDTLDGPVVADARTALEKGDVTPALKWVEPESEPEILRAFAQSLTVRKLSRDAMRLAGMYFFETLVRVHRAGEGAPYTGLKPAGAEVDPGIEAADRSLQTGKVAPVVTLATDRVAEGIRPATRGPRS